VTEKLEAGGSKLEVRRVVTPPKQPDAEPVCLLDKEWAERRQEPPDAFLASARSQENLPNGAEFRFGAQPGMWERVATFVAEERECCPFFAFEQWEDGGEVVLKITRPREEE
jgi:hypothetical protein